MLEVQWGRGWSCGKMEPSPLTADLELSQKFKSFEYPGAISADIMVPVCTGVL